MKHGRGGHDRKAQCRSPDEPQIRRVESLEVSRTPPPGKERLQRKDLVHGRDLKTKEYAAL